LPLFLPAGKKRIWKTSGVYKDTLQNYQGCDSILTINLTVKNVDVSVTQSGKTLTATNTTGIYEWLDCANSMSPIGGETARTFTPKKSGNYAVQIEDNGCIDTSVCYAVTVVSVANVDDLSSFSVIPNPNNGIFDIKLPVECPNAVIRIRDISGKLIFEQSFEKLKQWHLELSKLNTSGLYTIEINSPQFKAIKYLSIQL
jgi:hypothetical protein